MRWIGSRQAWVIAAAVAIGSTTACSGGEPAAEDSAPVASASISGGELVERLGTTGEPFILDVRSPDEFAAGHVPGAVNVPYDEVPHRLEELNAHRDREVVVYCRSGRRAGIAEETLREAGFEQVRDLEGHMLRWLEEGRPVDAPAE